MDQAEEIINRVFTDIACAPATLLDETLPYPQLLQNIHNIRSYQYDMIDPLYRVLLEAYPLYQPLLDYKRNELQQVLQFQTMEWQKGLLIRYGTSYLLPCNPLGSWLDSVA